MENFTYPFKIESDLDRLVEQAGSATAVLIGEATHGTSEFYTWRARLTLRLIEEKGFSFVAVEGDWPNCYRVNQFVKDPSRTGRDARDMLETFNRWPTWLWANFEVLDFIEWLANHNRNLPADTKVGFYGLDVYSLWESLSTAVMYLESTVPEAAEIARKAYRCFEPYRRDIERYTWEAASLPESCEDEVVRLLSTLEHLPPAPATDAEEEKFNAEQNALVAANAERYYRIMLRGDPESWNVRVEHMSNTFFRLLNYYERGPQTKGIIWAHNTHVGDARATTMADLDEFSIGQIVRGALGLERTYLIGFGTYEGEVIAADDWGTPAKKMVVPPAVFDSWEFAFHGINQEDRMVLFQSGKGKTSPFAERKGHRAIGVVYDPNAEFANYIPTVLSDRYDAFLYIDKTSVLHPLPLKPVKEEPPETFPSAA